MQFCSVLLEPYDSSAGGDAASRQERLSALWALPTRQTYHDERLE